MTPWDTRWPPKSAPLPPQNGLATSKKRGAMATTWWSQRFVAVLESYGLGARMQRGRRYARTGQVMTLDVRTSRITAKVQGSRRTPYGVTISVPKPKASQWKKIDAAMSAKVGFAAQLLAGDLPPELEDVFALAGVQLFPREWSEVDAVCTCPDWENPCKHIAAVLYVFADMLDADPWLMLAWRGRTRDEVLGRLRRQGSPRAAPPVAAWWPFAPGPLPEFDNELGAPNAFISGDVLERLAPLDVNMAGAPFVGLLRPVYEAARPRAGG